MYQWTINETNRLLAEKEKLKSEIHNKEKELRDLRSDFILEKELKDLASEIDKSGPKK